MTRRIGWILAIALAALAAPACTVITSAAPSSNSTTGEAWYTESFIFIVPLTNNVYHCDGKSNVCQKAEMR